MIFRFNLLKIEKNNADKNSTIEMAVNMFADRTPQEFAKVLGSGPPPDDDADDGIDDGLIESFGDGKMDYTNETCNGPVDNQGKLLFLNFIIFALKSNHKSTAFVMVIKAKLKRLRLSGDSPIFFLFSASTLPYFILGGDI